MHELKTYRVWAQDAWTKEDIEVGHVEGYNCKNALRTARANSKFFGKVTRVKLERR